MVYYRKYRPQTISELDLVTVREKLTSILGSNNIPHAFLFAGPKGLGKTSAARILAKAINCEQRLATSKKLLASSQKKASSQQPGASSLEIEPCNVCSACISITNGSNVDVLEIDAASNRGIDEIRDLRERIKFSPASLKKKVYIIDEVHMLTTEAFNALLKTLEEPPEHVIFILATTETGKLPATIMSRVFQVKFDKPSKEEIASSLRRVAGGENLEIDEEVIEKIGELSDGAFRDGAKILEELSLQAGGKKITSELLEKQYKTGSIDNSVDKLVDLTLDKKVKEVIDVINLLAEQNTDFKLVIEKMAGILHGKLLDAVSKKSWVEVTSVQKLLELLDEAYKNLKGAVLPQLPLELAVIEFCTEQNSVSSISYPVFSIDSKEKGKVIANEVKQSLETDKIASSSTPRNDTSSNLDLFKKLIASVNSENKILAGLLRGVKLESMENGKVMFKAQSSFHRDKLSEAQNKLIVEKKLSELLGRELKLEFSN